VAVVVQIGLIVIHKLTYVWERPDFSFFFYYDYMTIHTYLFKNSKYIISTFTREGSSLIIVI